MLPLAVPAPIFRDAGGMIDRPLNARYARRLAGTWVEHIVLAGPMGNGEACTSGQRAELLDIWTTHVDPSRLIVTCWTAEEIGLISARGIRPLAILALDTDEKLLAELGALPRTAIAYTNPRYSRSLITPALLATASGRAGLPGGLKFSKVGIDDLARVRRVVGPDVIVIHGSSRCIADSFAAGVTIVVSSPLGALPSQWPAPTVDAVQHAVDGLQLVLDQQNDHLGRVGAIDSMARESLRGTRVL
jgi:dihydrodipicolinate synthase/N-acetylneuraminate lyase